jgi:ribonuclease HII
MKPCFWFLVFDIEHMNFKYERNKLNEGYEYVIGCDEVGRGCLAGPVISAVVIFDSICINKISKDLRKVCDSKLLISKKRVEVEKIIKDSCLSFAIGEADNLKIDEINIHYATLLSMKRALESLDKKYLFAASLLAIDGLYKVPAVDLMQEAIVGGDNKVLSIAAASIVAKVYRDNLMVKAHEQYPQFNFDKHKGYATLLHRKKIVQFGLCPIHRLNFCSELQTPVRKS